MVLVAGAVTSGNRSGNFAISANALDALLMPVWGKLLAPPRESLGWPGFSPTRNFRSYSRGSTRKRESIFSLRPA